MINFRKNLLTSALSLSLLGISSYAYSQTVGPLDSRNNLGDLANTAQAVSNLLGAQTIPSTTSALASGGLNSRPLSQWLGDWINVKGQNVSGNGSINDSSALSAAISLAIGSGTGLMFPSTTTGSYLLNSNVSAAAGDLSVYMAQGANFSGTGMLTFENQVPHYTYPIFASILNSKTYSGSLFSGYANIDLLAAIAINNGVGNTIAVFGESVSVTSASPSWGGNFICVPEVSGAACNAVEIDTVSPVSGGAGYGLLISAQGSFNSQVALTIGGTTSGVRWLDAIHFAGTAIGNAPPVANYLILTDIFSGSVQGGLFFRGTYSVAEINFPSFLVGPTTSGLTSRIELLGGSGAGSTLKVVPNDGGSTANEVLSLQALGSGVVNIGNSNGTQFQVRDGGANTTDFGSVQGGPSGNPGSVTFGCAGTDANINCIIAPHGTGAVTFQNTGGGAMAQFTAAASTISRLQVTAAVSGSPVKLGVGGTATDLALDSGSGNVIQFFGAGSFTANGTGAVSITNLGPSGAHATIQKWLTIKDNGGVVGYIPIY